MPEGEKLWGGPVLMVGIICPPPVGIGLTDLPNIGGASGPPAPPVPAPLYRRVNRHHLLGRYRAISFRATFRALI